MSFDKKLVQYSLPFFVNLGFCLALFGVATPSAAPETIFDGVPRTSLKRNTIYKKNSITCLLPFLSPKMPTVQTYLRRDEPQNQ